jgi:hypothetical protein
MIILKSLIDNKAARFDLQDKVSISNTEKINNVHLKLKFILNLNR